MNIILALSITLAIELIVISIFFFKDIKTFLVMSLANIILNVSMNLLSLLMTSVNNYRIFLIIYEIMTFIIEALILIYILKKKKTIGYLASFLANGASFGIGILMNNLAKETKITIILIVIFASIYSITFLVNLFFYLLDKNKANYSS